MFCGSCGAPLLEGATFCTECGASQGAPAPASVPAEKLTPTPPVASYANAPRKESYFDGSMIGLLGIRLLTALVTLVTIGLAWPAMHCMYLRWYYKNSVIGGYRLKFTGGGGGLFGRYLLWVLLTVITIGIFGLWVPIKYNQWVTKNVEIDYVEPPRT